MTRPPGGTVSAPSEGLRAEDGRTPGRTRHPQHGAEPAVDVARERADIALLTGPDVAELLQAVLATGGAALVSSRVHRVHHRPGVGVTVGYVVHRADPSAGATGTVEDYLLATTAPVPDDADVVTALVRGRAVRVWRHPGDPTLPGLAAASSTAWVGRALGLPGSVRLDLVTYRPLRRAVLRVRSAERTAYLKVVRPHTAALLHRRHELLGQAGLPVARTTLLVDGVLALAELEGERLTDALAADGAAGVRPETVLDLLDRLPDDVLHLPRRPSWSERVLTHAAAAAAALPDRAGEIEQLGQDLADLVARTDPGPVVPSHGDLHEANLLVRDGVLVGLLDVDSVGPGHRVDDLACLLAHMSVLPALDPVVHRHVPAALPRWTAVLERQVDPVGLRARAAAVALSLVAGARGDDGTVSTDAEGRIAAARAWYEEALRLERDRPQPGAARQPDARGTVPAPSTRGEQS